MEKLYMWFKGEKVQIPPEMVEKFNLKAGMTSPFTRKLIVDENGEAPEEEEERGLPDGKGELINDEIAQLDNGMTLSTSEMIDIAQGWDSHEGAGHGN